MNLERNFWRLFADYENLTRNQSTAIWEGNFDVLTVIHEKKAVILGELVRISKVLGLDTEQPALKLRLALLVADEQQNSDFLVAEIEKARLESQILDVTSNRLQAVERVYVGEVHNDEPPILSGHG